MTRMIQLALATTRPRRAVPGRGVLDPSVTQLRVRLGDLDFYRHVNNGVYLQMMDVARSNFLADLGAFRLLNERGWYPVVASSTISYRRSLTLGQRFEITTRLLGWDPRCAYLEQVFTRGDEHVARGVIAGGSSAGTARACPRRRHRPAGHPRRPLARAPCRRAGVGRGRRRGAPGAAAS